LTQQLSTHDSPHAHFWLFADDKFKTKL
jgi:hypothetical protein